MTVPTLAIAKLAPISNIANLLGCRAVSVGLGWQHVINMCGLLGL
jgi:hypothetical protein